MGLFTRKWQFQKQASSAKNRRNLLGAYAKAVLYRTRNGSFLTPVEDIEIGKRIGENGHYDLQELEEIEQFLDSDTVVFVVGTHIGLLLVPIAKKAKGVIGYEANPNTYGLVSLNMVLNDLNNTRLFNYAVGDTAGEVDFYLNLVNSGGSKIRPKKDQFMYRFDNPETITVPMIGIDEHVLAQQLPHPDVIIMDIEGAEFYALKGMQNTLSASKALYIEFIPHHLQNVSAVTSSDFLSLILPHYNNARLMKQKETTYDLEKELKSFVAAIDSMVKNNKDDNILFYK
jgi:FkbM family methyltransferase